MNNKDVRELRESFYQGQANNSESSNEESSPTTSENVIYWIFDSMSSKLMEFLSKITDLINEAFQIPDHRQQTNNGLGEKVRAAFMLTAIVLLIVVMTRATQVPIKGRQPLCTRSVSSF